MGFPETYTNAVDGVPGVGTPARAAHINDLEHKVGIDLETDPTSLDYMVRHREPMLGNPAITGYILSSTAEGVRTWISPPSTMIYPGAGIAKSTGSGWDTSIADNSGNWNTAYGWGNHASAGYLTAETDPVWNAAKSGYFKKDTDTLDSILAGVTNVHLTSTLKSNYDSAYSLRHAQSHVLNGADHTVSGLTPGHFLKALTDATFGFAAHGLTYSDVGALASGGTATDSDKLDGQHGAYYAIAGAAPAAHALIDTTGHTASGLTTGHFLKATGATTYAFGAHGLSYGDVGAAPLSHAHAWGDITSGVPTTWTPIAHDLLSAYHGDTTGGSVVRGDIITGQGISPNTKWAQLVKGTSGYFFKAGADDVGWAAHGLTYSDVGAAASSHTQAVSTISDSTTVGQNLVKLTDPSAITFIRINANNSVDALGASDFRTAIGAGSSSFDGTWGSLSGKPTIVVTFGNLSNSAGWLHNDGAGALAWSTPSYSDVGADQAGAAAARQAAFTILTTLGNLSTVTTGWLHNNSGTLAYSTPTYSDVGADVAGAAAARQAAFTILTTLGNLSNAPGWLHNDGAGALAYSTPTYSDVGALASGGTAANSSQLEGHAAAYFQIAGSYQASSAILSALAGLTYVSGTPLIRMTGASAFSLDTATYLTSVTAHNLLSTTHGDTTASACARGSVIIGDSNSKWVNLAFPATPTGKVLQATATDVTWSTSALGSAAYTATSAYEASGAIASHAALITGVHGLVFTAGKTLTLTESLTLNALPIGGLAVATGANALGSLAVGVAGQYLAGGGAGTVPSWATLNQAAVGVCTAGYVPYSASGSYAASPIYTDGTKVGIGTTTLSRQFNLSDPSASVYAKISSSATNLNAATQYEDGTNAVYVGMWGASGAGTTGSFVIYASGIRLVVQQDGNVGIGTTSPVSFTRSLQVVSTGAASQTAIAASTDDRFLNMVVYNSDTGGSYGGDVNTWYSSSGKFNIGTATNIGGTGYAAKFTIDSSGNVGIGTNPTALLTLGVADGSSEPIRFIQTGGTKINWQIGNQINTNNAFEITPSTAAGGTTFSTPAITILSGGYFGFNTATPRRRGDILDTAGPQLRLTYTDNSVYVDQLANASGQWVVTPSAGALGGLLFATAGVMSTKAIGSDVQAYNSYLTAINQALTTTSSPTFTAITAATLSTVGQLNITPAAGYHVFFNMASGGYVEVSGGDFYMGSGGIGFGGFGVGFDADYALEGLNNSAKKAKAYAWDTWASSVKWKRDIVNIDSPLDKIKKLNGITFTHSVGENEGKAGIGITFEDLESLGLPNLAHRNEKGEPSGINLTNLIPLMVETIKVQQSQIDKLKEARA